MIGGSYVASACNGTLKGLVRHTTHVARSKHEEETTISFTLAYQGRVCPELNYLSGEYTNRSNPPIQAATNTKFLLFYKKIDKIMKILLNNKKFIIVDGDHLYLLNDDIFNKKSV